jgi:hypothetical protein
MRDRAFPATLRVLRLKQATRPTFRRFVCFDHLNFLQILHIGRRRRVHVIHAYSFRHSCHLPTHSHTHSLPRRSRCLLLSCAQMRPDQTILINVSGRGDKDMMHVAKVLGVDLGI